MAGLALPLHCPAVVLPQGTALGLALGIPSLLRWLWGTEGWQGQGPPPRRGLSWQIDSV